MYQQEECGTRITDSNYFSVIHSAFLERIVDLTIVHSSEIKGPLKNLTIFVLLLCAKFSYQIMIHERGSLDLM